MLNLRVPKSNNFGHPNPARNYLVLLGDRQTGIPAFNRAIVCKKKDQALIAKETCQLPATGEEEKVNSLKQFVTGPITVLYED